MKTLMFLGRVGCVLPPLEGLLPPSQVSLPGVNTTAVPVEHFLSYPGFKSKPEAEASVLLLY